MFDLLLHWYQASEVYVVYLVWVVVPLGFFTVYFLMREKEEEKTDGTH